MLAAGIDVWSTMNVQPLDSLNDVVSSIDDTDEVVLVDLPPDELLLRLKQGRVYLAQQAENAVRNFFRKGNLIALRELALRRTADRVDDHRRNESVRPVWRTREALLLAIGPEPDSVAMVRATLRPATQLDVPWHGVYVETPQGQRLPNVARQRILQALKLAQGLGATSETLSGASVANALIKYARDHNLSKLV